MSFPKQNTYAVQDVSACVSSYAGVPPSAEKTQKNSLAASVSLSVLILGKGTKRTKTQIECKGVWVPDCVFP